VPTTSVIALAAAAPAAQDWRYRDRDRRHWNRDRRHWDRGRHRGWDRGRYHRGNRYCRTEWRHHRRVQVCYRR
jgi:hypothetical protein